MDYKIFDIKFMDYKIFIKASTKGTMFRAMKKYKHNGCGNKQLYFCLFFNL